MKIKLLILFIILIQTGCNLHKKNLTHDFSKSVIIKEATKLVHKSERKLIKTELEDVFSKVQMKHKIDLSLVDTLYIIRGLNITNGFIHGRIWNDEIMIHYFDDRQSRNEKFAINPKISTTENSTSNFDTLIQYVENNDTSFITQQAKENQLLSGIPGWLIISFKKNKNQQYETTYFTVVDFFICENLNLD